MRKMALDVGDSRIGVAFSDPTEILATGYETYNVTKNKENDFKYFADLAKSKECDTIVLGLPKNMDGTDGERVEITKMFGDELSKYTDLPIVYHDERLSTVEAVNNLRMNGVRCENMKQVVDKVAATVILQNYLDKLNKKRRNDKMADNEKDKTYVEEDDEIVTLTYDDGETEDFYDLAELDYEGKWYIYLTPVNPREDFDEDEVIIYEMGEDENGEEIFLDVEDDDLLNKLVELLNKEAE